ncbi:MAG: hypothetical protein DRM99_04875 [Thermoplasmata archaeon]|nr:MAG: hypothetical protein DRM99_04875 [Thermoplasmata archaeon]
MIRAYVDGSFKQNKCFWAYLLKDAEDDSVVDKQVGEIKNPISANIDGEVYSVIFAVQKVVELKKYKTIEIYYDYLGLENWITGKWKINSLISCTYKSIIDKLVKNNGLELKFIKVKAHDGVMGNIIVDKMLSSMFKNANKKK